MEYWMYVDGRTQGPFSATEVRAKAQPASLVSHGNQWINYSSHPDFPTLTPPPPPLPKTACSRLGLDVDRIRADNETVLLYVSIGVLAAVVFFFITASLGIAIVILAVAVFWVKMQQGQLLGRSVKVSVNQFPRIYKLCEVAAQRLRMTMPEVFVMQNPTLNAFALGILDRKSVVLHSATIEALTDEELLSIIGHEFTHIKGQHTSWLVLMDQGTGVGIPIVSFIINQIFNGWSRKAEYTADRGSLIVSRNVAASIAALAKLTVGKELFEQMNLDSFVQQKMEADQDDAARLAEYFGTHPYITNRIQGLAEFSRSNLYIEFSTD